MAEPLYYASVHVDGVINAESVEDILTSTEEEPKTLVQMWHIMDSAALTYDAVMGCYIEREKVVDAPMAMFLNAHDAEGSQLRNRTLELNHELPVGQSFRVGHTSGGTATDAWYMVAYHIRK